MEGIYPLLKEAELEISLDRTYSVLRVKMEGNMLQKLNKAKDMSDQKFGELEGSLGLAFPLVMMLNGKKTLILIKIICYMKSLITV